MTRVKPNLEWVQQQAARQAARQAAQQTVEPDPALDISIAAARAANDAGERQKLAVRARDDLLLFTQLTMPDPEAPDDPTRSRYVAAAFHKAIAKALEDVVNGDTRQLIFCMPPRHGKTELATKRLAAWFSGRYPEQNIAVGTYNDELANDLGTDTRAILQAKPFRQIFPLHALRRGGAAKTNIQTQQGGRIVFVGRGGGLTGRGAHLLLLDDLFKDYEDARSKANRDSAWNWFTKVAMTRRMGRKLVIITMTRWHSDDVIGRLTDPENPNYPGVEEARRWKIIRLPAIAEDDDPAGRAVGEALWPDGPDKYDLDFLQSQQRIDPLGFEALFQQRPTVADGVLFRRETIQRYRQSDLPNDLRYYAASDHAVGTGQRNDYTVLLLVGVDPQDNIYLIDCDWRRMKPDQAVEAMLALGGSGRKPILWWAGRDHITKSLGPFLRKRMVETGNYINIRELPPIGDKEQRAQSIAARVSMGKVYLPSHAPWAERAIDEMLAFPNGTHDDFVDTIANIGLGMQSMFGAKVPKPEKKPPVFGTLGWCKMMDQWREDQKRAADRGGF